MSAIMLAILTAAYNFAVPFIQAKFKLAVSKAGTLTALDVLKTARVAFCAASGCAVVHALDRVIPDGLVTYAVAGAVAGVIDLGYRLVKGK